MGFLKAVAALDDTHEDALSNARAKLLKRLLEAPEDRKSRHFAQVATAWRKAWFKFYNFKLEPSQEENYFKVLLEREPDPQDMEQPDLQKKKA